MAELDAALLELLDALELMERTQRRMRHCLSEGWLLLSQCRYAVGSHSVSALHYAAVMEPRVRVRTTSDPDGGSPQFHEVSGTTGDPKNVDPHPGGEGRELRQRRGHEEISGPPPKSEGEGSSSPPPPQDPLRWFGVLVPPSLRQAQEHFKEAVTLAVQVATLQGTVQDAALRYRKLVSSVTQ